MDQAVEMATSCEETCRDGIARYRKERSQAVAFLAPRDNIESLGAFEAYASLACMAYVTGALLQK